MNVFVVFMLDCDQEFNTVVDFIGLAKSEDDAKSIVSEHLKPYMRLNMQPMHKQMTPENNYTYFGSRNDFAINRGLSAYGGFLVETWPIRSTS